MRDGTVLATDVWRPDDGERHPVLLQRTPYDKTYWPFTWAPLDPTKAAEAGFVVAIQDVRGRFRSAGEFVSPYAADADDGADAVAWAAGLPASDGTVGMYGVSYMAAVQWLAASRRPPALRAIAPATSPNPFDPDDWHRGGALQLGLITAWTMFSIGPNAIVRRHLADPPALARALAALVDDIDALDEHARRLPLSPFPPVDDRGFAAWFGRGVSNEAPRQRERGHADVAVPALLIAGWHDTMLRPTIDHFAAMCDGAATPDARRLTRIVIGPWAHGAFPPVVGEVDFGVRASGFLLDLREDLTQLHRRWFDARCKGIDTGIDDEPPVRLFVMGANRWRDEDAWPPARARPRRWHLHGGGGLSPRPPQDAGPSLYWLDPADPVPTHGGTVLAHPKHIRGPREQAPVERRADVLAFTSEPLDTDLEATGPVRLVAWVATETVDSDVVARLCDVGPDGRSYNVCDGILRLRFRDGLADAKLLTPGEVVRAQVDLWSTSYLFRRGHRLRVQVCASDFPRYDRCPGTGESSATAKEVLPQRNRLFHDPVRPSYVELPEVGS